MDAQGVGAIAAAAVAAATVPITVLVGRWQVRAAIRAGEATYRAAVDAAQQQGTAAHSQWRREVRRDAYAAFLSATHQVVQLCERLRPHVLTDSGTASESEIDQAARRVADAVAIIALEGPEPASRTAELTSQALTVFISANIRRAEYRRATAFIVGRLQAEHDNNIDGGPASQALEAISGLREIAQDELDDDTFHPHHLLNLMEQIPGGMDHYAGLMRGLRGHDPNEIRRDMESHLEEFMRAARSALD